MSEAPADADGPFHLDIGPLVRPAYGPADVPDTAVGIGDPGGYPYTRGIHSDGLRTSPTLVKVYSGLGTPEATNLRFRRIAGWGADIIQIAADLPSQLGYDPDHLMSTGEVGRAGVSIASLRDMETVYDGVPIDRIARVGMLANAIGPVGVSLFAALAERRGLATADVVVDLQNDPLKEYVARGTQILPIEPALRLAGDVVEWCAEHAPHWYPLDVCVNHLNSAGAGSTRGTAFAFANAIAYIEHLVERGLPVDSFASMIQFFLDEREDFFVALANVRATRRIWAELLRDRFGAREERSLKLALTAYGHGRETRREPLNNTVRIALGSLAYYFGGIQSMYTASYDEVLQTPSEASARIAVRTQQIFANELGLGLTADPLGGSYYLEALTGEIEAGIREHLAAVEDEGGAVACIQNGYMRQAISEGAVRRQRRYEQGLRPMVGVDRFVDDGTDDSWTLQPTAAMTDADEQRRRDEVAELRRTREQRPVADALRELEQALRQGRNSVPPVLAAVRAHATIGEICDVMREVFGEWEPDQTF